MFPFIKSLDISVVFRDVNVTDVSQPFSFFLFCLFFSVRVLRLCSGQPVFVGNHSSVSLAQARVVVVVVVVGGRLSHEFTSQNAPLSDMPPSKTYRHSGGEW